MVATPILKPLGRMFGFGTSEIQQVVQVTQPRSRRKLTEFETHLCDIGASLSIADRHVGAEVVRALGIFAHGAPITIFSCFPTAL